MTLTNAHLGDLKSDPRNARRHTPRNVGLIEDALHEVGAGRSIVIDENNVVLAGNATIEAAASAGIERVQIVDTDGETLIAVRRTDLTAKQKQRLALLDNRTAELAEWDADVIADMLREDEAALAGLFYEWELDKLAGNVGAYPDSADEWQGMPEFEQDEVADNKITVYFADADGRQDFAELIGQRVSPETKYVWFPKEAKPVRQDVDALKVSSES